MSGTRDMRANIPASPIAWENGEVRVEWRAFFQQLWGRTGAAQGGTINGVTAGTGLSGGGSGGVVTIALVIPVAIVHGGTGATTAPQALTNLGAVARAGDTMTGFLTLNADPTAALEAATKQYVDAQIGTLHGYIQQLGARQNNALTATPANPPGTVSATNVMLGLGISVTLSQNTTRAIAMAGGQLASSANNGISTASLWVGTGTPPANGAAVPTGAVKIGADAVFDANPNTLSAPFSINGAATGLTPGGTYWVDLALRSGGGTASVSQLDVTAFGLIDTLTFP